MSPSQVTDPAPLGGRVWIVAHRGASHDAPEHTVAAYDRAVGDGTDFLEADLWLSRDGNLVCIHDETVDRTSDGSGAVASFTTEELCDLDFGSWFNAAHPDRARPEFNGARVVLFEEMLDRYSAAHPHLRFHVETKHPYISGREAGAIDTELEHELLRVLDEWALIDGGRVVIQSFWPRSLELIAQKTDGVLATALLSAGPSPDTLPEGVTIAAPNHKALLGDLDYIRRTHSRGVEVHTWTVDDPSVMRTLVAAGVDAIFTNRPAALRGLVESEFPQWASPGPGRPATQP